MSNWRDLKWMKIYQNFTDKQIVNYFKYASIAEGISCILLYLIAMPIKYQFDIYWQMIPIGSLHGLFFTLYLFFCVPAWKILKWDDEDFVFALLASLFPFATFIIERDLVRKRTPEGLDKN